MKISKKGFIGTTTILLLLIAVVFGLYAVPKIKNIFTGTGLAIEGGDVDTEAKKDIVASSCDGVQSVKALYDDKDAFKVGTDPGGTLFIYDPQSTDTGDDSTAQNIPTLTQYKALAGKNGTGYYAREVQFTTECSDVPIQTELFAVKTPTITVVQDDGITKFTSSEFETVAASTAYTASYTVKSPAEGCVSVYGAVFACEYDATYINKIESSDLADFDTGIYLVHQSWNTSNYTTDQWKTFKWTDADNKLCDGDKAEFDIEYTLGSTTINDENQADINCTWMGINKDLDADTDVLITGIYDEDKNEIFRLANSGTIYTDWD